MVRSYTYRLYPNRTQTKSLLRYLAAARYVYNEALSQRRGFYKSSGKSLSYKEQCSIWKELRNEDPQLKEVIGANPLQRILRRVDKAYAAFFRRVESGEKPGFPRFKGANRFHSFDVAYGFGTKLEGNRLYLQNIGNVKVKLHRPIPDGAVIKQVIVKKKINKWFVSFQLELKKIPVDDRIEKNRTPVGIDMGLLCLLACSNGAILHNPRWFRESEAELRRAQRHLSRCRRGSKGWYKAKRRVAQVHARIARRRHDFWHQVTRYLVRKYDLIALEDLTLNFMIKNRYLAKSALDAGLGMFQQLLRYKAEEAGTEVVLVDPRNTSQECSGCGRIVKKSLSVRVHSCPHCGLVLDRDVNSGRVILKRARTEPSQLNVGSVPRAA